VHPEAYVHASAVLIGDVQVGRESSVWPNAVLRGDDASIVIGEQTSIQDGTIIHNTTGLSHTVIGDRVTVGHGVILHGCIIEELCVIGMGCIILDNAVIERGSIVGAGALVPPGKRIAAGSVVVGNPARVHRQCSDADRQAIEFGWQEYVKRTREYRARDA
jgi:carbonic anhydrase/acetyltransferase-like protein (isoleucine patch superfamily)